MSQGREASNSRTTSATAKPRLRRASFESRARRRASRNKPGRAIRLAAILPIRGLPVLSIQRKMSGSIASWAVSLMARMPINGTASDDARSRTVAFSISTADAPVSPNSLALSPGVRTGCSVVWSFPRRREPSGESESRMTSPMRSDGSSAPASPAMMMHRAGGRSRGRAPAPIPMVYS